MIFDVLSHFSYFLYSGELVEKTLEWEVLLFTTPSLVILV